MLQLALILSSASGLTLLTFDGAPGTTFKFTEMNDPVMGGQSTGDFTVDAARKVGVFKGECVNVPKLKAPGFLKASTSSGYFSKGKFADASGNTHLVLRVRSLTPYTGYKVSLGHNYFPVLKDYKADFNATSEWSDVMIPFSAFSDNWSSYTGEPVTTCDKDPKVCVTDKTLKNIEQIAFWAEGVAAKVHLEIESVSVAKPQLDSGFKSKCSGPVQAQLRFNMSAQPAEVPVPVDPTESLAEAICCDPRTRPYAEPQFFFRRPEIALFSHVSEHATFYDSVCGIPLFNVPKNRTWADFVAETQEHGWPSFRESELVPGSIVVSPTDGDVYSSCGTYLGSILPDEKGQRYCLDLSCVSGSPAVVVV
jgi:hypothetical protein